MKKITIISGKGGTGKTTITAGFAAIEKNLILADCDVDSPNLQILLNPEIKETKNYIELLKPTKTNKCTKCGKCREICNFNAINTEIEINQSKCEGCAACEYICPENAIKMKNKQIGTIYKSKTKYGPFIHAKLKPGEEASGKIVTQVQQWAQKTANKNNTILIDGSPGIGCPVIASIKSTDKTLIVTEPTVSGIHDLKRIIELTKHFQTKTQVCINKHDLNPKNTKKITEICKTQKTPVIGKIPYTQLTTKAMINKQPITEYTDTEITKKIKKTWKKLKN
ncbi:ATP-binding protein [Methanonatronarchaeum sp. AMET-Sl]|uniref:ATP-binding protein n=1 Tax=Methanonatronarchaeum sp. AMET-Sl TaxID=3037654 RepID=UPI00244E135F|nr:ATP-binding protein [Methanonatronarchaeum sp. AMET-Sl]WGI17478.1 ATP-binding protein [Methanonatronarchaeum sp. AMET-Sl]